MNSFSIGLEALITFSYTLHHFGMFVLDVPSASCCRSKPVDPESVTMSFMDRLEIITFLNHHLSCIRPVVSFDATSLPCGTEE